VKTDRINQHVPALVCAWLGVFAAAAMAFALYIRDAWDAIAKNYPLLGATFERMGIPAQISGTAWIAWGGFAILILAAGLTLIRRPFAIKLVRKAIGVGYVMLAIVVYQVIAFTGLILTHNIEMLGVEPTREGIFWIRLDLLWPAALLLVGTMVVHVLTWRAAVLALYRHPLPRYTAVDDDDAWYVGPRAPGDRVIENLRTHGRDAGYRVSVYRSVFTHVFIIFILPWLLEAWGCVEAYRIPKGSGDPVVALIQVVKPQKKPKKTYVLNPMSDISFHIPDLDESKLLEEVQQQSMVTYTAEASRVHGKIGQGGGKTGGWPDGMDDAIVRFIRLEHNGPGWDDGMSEREGNADHNFLNQFAKITGFKTRRRGESHRIALLANYPTGQAPPFVYFTGSGAVNFTEAERRVLRQYVLDGGLIFADADTMPFDRAFRAAIQTVFPGQPILTIANDDPLFQMPYVMPNGAPAFQLHGTARAMGIKVRDRWGVIYFAGDINDAWKDGARSDARTIELCYQMGINVVYYAFTHYLRVTAQQRK